MVGLPARFPITARAHRSGHQIPAEPLYAVDGTPRWRLKPDVAVAPGADILAAGVAELRRLTA